MSAFSSKFPDGLQTIGLYLGVALALICVSATTWHCVDRWRITHNKPGLKLEPNYLIIFGLVVACIGVAWQTFFWEPSPEADSLELRDAPSKGPSELQLSGTTRFYSAGDKERISEAFFRLSEILNKPVAKIEKESQGLIGYWDGLKMDPDRRTELQNIINQLHSLRVASGEANRKYEELLKDYLAYPDLLQEIVQTPKVDREKPIPRWQYAANDFIKAVTTYETLYGGIDSRAREDLAAIIDPTKDIFRNAVANLNDWIHQSNKRIEAKRAAILK